MMRLRTLASLLSVGSLFLFGAAPARADILSFGVGALGGGGVVGLSKPGDKTVTVGGRTGEDTTYPGFFGSTVGAGVSAEGRLFNIVGLEVDLMYHFSDHGSGDLTLGNTKYSVSIGQPALHVPILAKVVLPTGIVRPFAGIGPEIVLPGTSSADVTPAGTLVTKVGANADSYVLLAATLGVEIKLPIPALDLRIPVALRAGLNPGTSDKVVDRRTSTIDSSGAVSGIVYKSEWQYQGTLMAGVAYWF